MNNLLQKYAISILALSIVMPNSAMAVGTIKSPYVNKDELKIEYKGFRFNDDKKPSNNKQKHVAEVSYGLTDNLAVEVEGIFERSSGDDIHFEKMEYELKYQLTEKDDYWWDAGVLGIFVHNPHDGKANKVEGLLLLQNDSYGFRHRANLILERQVGAGAKNNVDFAARWYSRYNLHKAFKPGIEWQGEFGKWNDFKASAKQEHFLGPKAYGHLTFLEDAVAGDGEFEYEAGYLFGLTDASADGVSVLKLEYKHQF